MSALKDIVVKQASKFGVKLVDLKKHNQPTEDMDPAFAEFFQACKPYTLLPVERLYSLFQAVEYIVKKKIPGDFVECGVYKGGASMMMAFALQHFGDTSRKIYMYDTYTGMTEPTKEDASVMSGKESVTTIWKRHQKDDHNDWCYGPLDEVQAAMKLTGYPMDQVTFVKGPVEETIPDTMPGSLAILRLDTDWYSSTKHELEHLYPLLITNGVLILDDYGYWAGARQAAKEYFANNDIHLFMHRDDYSGATGIKN